MPNSRPSLTPAEDAARIAIDTLERAGAEALKAGASPHYIAAQMAVQTAMALMTARMADEGATCDAISAATVMMILGIARGGGDIAHPDCEQSARMLLMLASRNLHLVPQSSGIVMKLPDQQGGRA